MPREAYLLRILSEGLLRREVELQTPGFSYDAAMRAADGATGPLVVQVAQVTDAWGAGPFATLAVPGGGRSCRVASIAGWRRCWRRGPRPGRRSPGGSSRRRAPPMPGGGGWAGRTRFGATDR